MAKFNTKFVVTPNERQIIFKRILWWLKRHKKIVIITFIFVMFMILLTCIIIIQYQLSMEGKIKEIANNFTDKTLSENKEMWSMRQYNNNDKCVLTDVGCMYSGKCTKISCKNTNIDYVIDFLKNIDNIELHLDFISFPNNVISKETLTKFVANVKYLSVIQCNIIDIEDCAFLAKSFQNLYYLVLSDVSFTYLERRMLCGLNLFRFEFKFNDFVRNFKFEYGVLENSTNLQILQIHRCISDNVSVLNITGTNEYFHLLGQIDFRYNSITSLIAYSFKAVENVEQIFLNSGSLEYIDEHAFDNLAKLNHLTLHNNRLITVSEEVFSKLNFKYLTLHNNRWECDCKLKWLQQYHKNSFVAQESIICNNLKESIDTATFCEINNVTSTTTIHTPSVSPSTNTVTNDDENDTSPETTTPKNDKPFSHYRDIKCKESFFNHDTKSESRKIESIRINEDDIILEFFDYYDNNDTYKVTMLIRHDNNFDISKYILLWFNYDNENYYCNTNLTGQVLLNEIESSTTYTMCLLQLNNARVEDNIYTPRHCRGLRTRDPWTKQPWITNDLIGTTIAVIIIIGIVLIILSTVITYFCIRKYPNLIKGNKKIIVIKEKDTTQYNQSQREFDRPAYADPSVITYDRGYLTPNLHKYSRIKYKPPFHTNPPNASIYSDNEIYIQADAPTRFQLETWRTNIRKRPRLDNIYNRSNRIDECIEYDEIPPPVPSGHPINRTRSTVYPIYNHNLYSLA